MKAKAIYQISSIAHLSFYDGKPCDMYTASVYIQTQCTFKASIKRYVIKLVTDKKEELEKYLNDLQEQGFFTKSKNPDIKTSEAFLLNSRDLIR